MRIVIAEDSVLLRTGLVHLLEWAGFDVAAAVGDAKQLLQAVQEHAPDLAIIDIRMPPTFTDEGIRAALTLRERRPGLAVLVLSGYVEERHAADLLSNDTSGVGYLLKDRVADIDDFVAGGTAVDPEVVAQLLIRTSHNPLGQLSLREREVLALMAEGRSNMGVATALSVSDSAVAKHITSIFIKLGLPAEESDHRRVLAVLQFLASPTTKPG